MCRLFGLHAGRTCVPATFWLLDAPDSLSAQSHQNPDGAGIGVFGDGELPTVDKQPIAAWQDAAFAAAARELIGTTFLAHVRYASTGALSRLNTHPFLMQGRMFAHNGVVEGLDQLEARLAELHAPPVLGQTDSERVFALITAETDRADGDVGAGLTAAIGWIGANLPLYAVNLVLTTSTDLWALRYPASHELYVLDRPATGVGLEARTDRIHARSGALASAPSVVVASEKMDDDPGWRLLEPGELLHVDADQRLSSRTPFDPVPNHLLALSDLAPATADSQHHR